jgi:RNA polymerase sigma-70 factor (ECF subfamily)
MNHSQEEFGKIYDRFVEKIYRFIFLKVNSQDISEDLTSETFLRCWEKYRDSNIDNVQAFLYKIARNLVVDHYREKGRVQFVSTDFLPMPGDKIDIKEKIEDSSDIADIRTALKTINEDYQDIIIWHYIDDLSVPEIAAMTNKSEGAVRVMLSRALSDLRNNIETS